MFSRRMRQKSHDSGCVLLAFQRINVLKYGRILSDIIPELMRILIIEDNKKLAQSLKRGLEQEGYAADCAYDGLEGERKLFFGATDYDAVILDIMLPGKNGLEICAKAREAGIKIPIIMLTAKDTVKDKVAGLDIGADDYLVKPFSFEELLSRIRALVRRPAGALSPTLHFGSLSLDPATRDVMNGRGKVDLTLTEFRLLELFMRNPGQVLDRQKLIDKIWDLEFNPLSRAADVHINNIRNKLGKNKHATNIETIRGVGYRLRA